MANNGGTRRDATGGVFGREPRMRPVEPDAPLSWGCSGKGWNCCVGKGISVWPYDLIRARHALGRSAQQLINDGTVTFGWYPLNGALVGMFARRRYHDGRDACIFLDEVTNRDVQARRDTDPAAFRALPDFVQRAATSQAEGEWKVAGLCAIHTGRPMVCRGFPFARREVTDRDSDEQQFGLNEVHRCGSCALHEPTTPRAVLEAEGIADYWRAWDAFEATATYLRGLGVAVLNSADHRVLPADEEQRSGVWVGMYVPESHPEITDRFGEQWREHDDADRDREIYRLVMMRALDEAERLVAESGIDPEQLGFAEEAAAARPDLDALLDPGRETLPPPDPPQPQELAQAG